jgi:hypothetical protein
MANCLFYENKLFNGIDGAKRPSLLQRFGPVSFIHVNGEVNYSIFKC